MPAIAFPAIKPSSRSYSPGVYAQKEFQALNGATTILRYGNRRHDAELSLSFQNISDDNAAAILAVYEQQHAGNNWVSFTASNGTAGASTSLAQYLGETVSGLRWRFAEPPSVDSVVPGRSNLKATFRAHLDSA